MCSMKERVIWMSCTCESGGATLEDGEGSRFWKNAHLHNEQALAMAVQWQCNGLHSGKNSASAQWKPAILGVIRKDLSLFGCSIQERAGLLGYITLHWFLLEKLLSTSKYALQSRKNPTPLPICTCCAWTLLHFVKGQQYGIWW